MLILDRKNGEAIIIGDNVKILFMGYKLGIARIGIEAPIEISIHREEIYDRIQREKKLMKEKEKNEQSTDA